MKKFEYKKIEYFQLKTKYYDELDETKLNLLGQDGWEFITIDSGKCLFKREINE